MSSSSDYSCENQQQAPSFNGGGGGDGKGVHHSGPLMQLSGKGLLHSGSWKRRYCVLDSQRLFYYPVKESSEAQIQDSEQLPPLCYREKTSHYVDLECYDICEEVAVGKDQRTNVIVLSSTDIENSFFETGRVYLSAETTNEMNEWISQIRSVMTAVRSGGGGTRVANPIKSPQTSQPTTPVKKRPAPAKPIDAIAATVSYSVANNTLISSTTTSTTTTTAAIGKKKSDAVAVDTMTTLDCNMAKQRAKGPTGRRLPRQVQSRLFPSSHSHSHHLQSSEQNKRSESLPRLEMDQSLQRLKNSSSSSSRSNTDAMLTSNQLISRLIRLDASTAGGNEGGGGGSSPISTPHASSIANNNPNAASSISINSNDEQEEDFNSTWFLSNVNPLPLPPVTYPSSSPSNAKSKLKSTDSTASNASATSRRNKLRSRLSCNDDEGAHRMCHFL